MFNLFKFLFNATITTLIATCVVNAQDLFTKNEPLKLEMFQKILATNTVGEYPILNVGGNWLYQMSKVTNSTGAASNFVPLGRLFGIDIRQKKMYASIDMTANLYQNSGLGDWTDEPCKREDFLYKRSIGGRFTNLNCATVNHITNFFVAPTQEFQQLAVYLREIDTEMPPTIIRVTFTRYYNQGRRLVYIIDINPEYFGVTRDATTVWGSNSWHKSFIEKDPKKMEFMNNLKKWVDATQDRIDNAFSKRLDAFAGLQTLDNYMTINQTSAIKEVTPILSIEDRIRTAKNLLDKGLISENQFNEQVKNILNQK